METLEDIKIAHTHIVGYIYICQSLLLPPSIFPSIRVFSNASTLYIGGQSIGFSASASVLPMNTQDWSPLGWTGWISLKSKGLSRVFSNTTVQKHQFFGAKLSLYSNSHIRRVAMKITGGLTWQSSEQYPGHSKFWMYTAVILVVVVVEIMAGGLWT